MTELIKEIVERFPKVWNKIIHDFSLIIEDNYDEFILYFNLCNSKVRLNMIKGTNNDNELSTSCFYSLFEKFFDDNGIIIIINHYIRYFFEIKNFNGIGYSTLEISNDNFESRLEAKRQAILKACEILEDRL